jgi:hypothetical protein
MKPIYILYVIFFISFYHSVLYAQIIDEIDLPTIEGGSDSLAGSIEKMCVPPCRKGFFCLEGQCISKCNPPCPDGMDCGEDAECHPRATTISNMLHEIQEISRVNTKNELVQGAVIKIDKGDARVRIRDTTFQCDGDLFLNLPVGEYDICIDAPRFFVNEEDLDVQLGKIDTIEVKLRPFQINTGVLLGASSMKEFSLLAGEVNLGVDFSALIHTGFTATYTGPIDSKPKHVTNYEYWYIPDTLKEVCTELAGFGVSFGYLAFKPIAHFIKFIPQIDIGYWKYDDQTYYLEEHSNGKTEYLDNLEHHTIRNYFVRPTLSIRCGERFFNSNSKISVYIGRGVPIVNFMSGFEVDFPR